MILAALFTIAYGLAMGGGGYAGFRLAGSIPSLVGGGLIGLLAIAGGVLMLFGDESGRGPALLGAVVAILFFGWKLSQAILNRQPVGRAGGIFALSLVEVVVLMATR